MYLSMFLRWLRPLAASGLLVSLGTPAVRALDVVPGLKGFGTNTTAARGTVNGSTGVTVYAVTTLADSLTPTNGMLRYGIKNLSGPRVIIFRVSGVIELRKEIDIDHSEGQLVIAGQTAPAGGITLKNAGFEIYSNDVLIQHIAIRPGPKWWNTDGTPWIYDPEDPENIPPSNVTQPSGWDLPAPGNRDAIAIQCSVGQSTNNIVIDHVSMAWGTDEVLSLWGGEDKPIRNVTISNCLIYEGLRHAANPQDEGPDGHSAGMLIGPNAQNVSVYRNVFAFNRWRNPAIGYGTEAHARIINNLVYAPGQWSGHRMQISSIPPGSTNPTVRATMAENVIILHQNPAQFGYAANYTHGVFIPSNGPPNIRLYLSNNRLWNWNLPVGTGGYWIPSSPAYNTTMFSEGINVVEPGSNEINDGVTQLSLSAADLETELLANAGARPAARDAVDTRIVEHIANDVFRDWLDTPVTYASYAGHRSDGYPSLSNTISAHNPAPPTGAAGQADPAPGNGYTALEEWLHARSDEVEPGGGGGGTDPIDPLTPILDNFEDNVANGWTPSGTHSWSIVTVGAADTPEHNDVYAQTSTSLDARSVLSGTNWEDQIVQADIKPTSLAHSNSWVGVLGRFRDTDNYYYLIIRQSGIIDLKKIVAGSASSLLTTTPSYTVNTSNTYRLKLEMNGTTITGTVSTWNSGSHTWTNVQTVSATDSSIDSGRAGLGMYRTAAQFNTVFASPDVSAANIFGDDFQDQNATGWSTTGGTWTVPLVGGSYVYKQSSTTVSGSIYATAGQNTWENQSLRVDMKPTAFGTATTPFFGLVARHINTSNYYYYILRKNGTIELKKYASGTQGLLDSADYTVTTGTTYDLRIDAIGPTLNAYIGQRLVLEAQDTSNAAGKIGFQLLNAAVEADEVLVTSQP